MNETIKDNMFATPAGGAIGDAFGYRIEFQSLAAIRARFGPGGLMEPIFDGQGRLIVSDDTQMALFTAEGTYQRRPLSKTPSLAKRSRSIHMGGKRSVG
jgi:ADP-ribosylglycohydrolase